MDQVSPDSANAIKILATASSRSAKRLHWRSAVKYLLVTVERASGLVYTPISNLSRRQLAVLNPRYATDLVGSIREQYLFPLSERGPVRELCDEVRKRPALLPVEQLLVLPIDDEGAPGIAAVFDDLAREQLAAGKALDAYFQTNRSLFGAEEWRRPLNQLRKQGGNISFLLRPESRFDSPTARRARNLDLMQMGIAISTGDTMSRQDVTICFQASLATSLGTLFLLHDKERYYERASRQAITGSVVKSDEVTEIRAQYDLFERLRDKGAINIPFPIIPESDPKLRDKNSPDVGASWYIMPWVQLPKLSETILRGNEFKRYELGALMRAAIVHLRQDYWDDETRDKNAQVTLSHSLWPSLLIAQKAIRELTTEAKSLLQQIRKEHPLLHARGVIVHDPSHIKQARPVLAIMMHNSPFEVALSWESKSCFTQVLAKPENVLKRFVDALKPLRTDQKAKRLYATEVHGDAHFLNLLVDSSVPEDPLVISIDPKPLDSLNSSGYRRDYMALVKETEKHKKEWSAIGPEFEAIKHDPAYDIAKYLMSTACFYGLTREGLKLEVDPKTNCFNLTNKSQVNKPLFDTGGISGAKLIRLRTGIPEQSLWNHLTCADAVVREFVQLFGFISPERRIFDTNVGLIGLWFLTIRTLFSTARALLPGDLISGSILYLVATAYMNDSSTEVLKALAGKNLRKPETQRALQDALRWESLEKKLARPEVA